MSINIHHSNSGGNGILLAKANFFSASHLSRKVIHSSWIFLFFACIVSRPPHSYNFQWKFINFWVLHSKTIKITTFAVINWKNPFINLKHREFKLTEDFLVSNLSFSSTRLTRQLAAYPRFLRVRRRCFIRTISLRFNPFIFNCRFKSLTEIDTNSSSLISGIGHGDSGGCKNTHKNNHILFECHADEICNGSIEMMR